MKIYYWITFIIYRKKPDFYNSVSSSLHYAAPEELARLPGAGFERGTMTWPQPAHEHLKPICFLCQCCLIVSLTRPSVSLISFHHCSFWSKLHQIRSIIILTSSWITEPSFSYCLSISFCTFSKFSLYFQFIADKKCMYFMNCVASTAITVIFPLLLKHLRYNFSLLYVTLHWLHINMMPETRLSRPLSLALFPLQSIFLSEMGGGTCPREHGTGFASRGFLNISTSLLCWAQDFRCDLTRTE